MLSIYEMTEEIDSDLFREMRLREASQQFRDARDKRKMCPCRDTTEDAVDAYIHLKRCMLNTLELR